MGVRQPKKIPPMSPKFLRSSAPRTIQVKKIPPMGVISEKKIPPMGYFWQIIFSEMPEFWHYSVIYAKNNTPNYDWVLYFRELFLINYHKKSLNLPKKHPFQSYFGTKQPYFGHFCPKLEKKSRYSITNYFPDFAEICYILPKNGQNQPKNTSFSSKLAQKQLFSAIFGEKFLPTPHVFSSKFGKKHPISAKNGPKLPKNREFRAISAQNSWHCITNFHRKTAYFAQFRHKIAHFGLFQPKKQVFSHKISQLLVKQLQNQ